MITVRRKNKKAGFEPDTKTETGEVLREATVSQESEKRWYLVLWDNGSVLGFPQWIEATEVDVKS